MSRPDRRSFCLVSLAFLIVMLGTSLPTPLYPLYAQQMGFSRIIITVIFAVYAIGVIAALIGFGSWSDQLGRKRLLIGGLGLAVISDIVFLCSGDLTLLLVARLFSGFSAGIFTGTATVAIIEQAPPAWQKGATLTATVTNVMGLGLGPFVGGLLAQYGPMPLMLPFALHLLCAVLAVIGVTRVPETVDRPAHVRLHRQRLAVPDSVRGVFIPAAIAGFAGTAVLGLFTAAAPSFVRELLGIQNLAVVGGVVITLFIASAMGQALLRFVPERHRLTGGCVVLALGVALVGASIGFASLGLMLLGATVSGLGQGITLRAGLGEVVAQAPARRKGEITSTYFVVIYVAISLPVVGLEALSMLIGLTAAGVLFAALDAVLALAARSLLVRRRAQGKA
ncbi:MFS transporter [Salinisphaera sp. Q1T1-3]|uniref:MFS transporter n=1 Tax=Salinisphaera sp. Q1T1-3 TaxID=2321229 RepID=UPI000E73D759|nr:MFS transporter [Salinisphaera sp. Q1T1-3]RJS93592.1 MFS transporter [Salinisphaera sp. Q1T1-3]